MNQDSIRQRFICALREYICTNKVLTSADIIDEYTPWENLPIDMIDQIMIEDLLRQMYQLQGSRLAWHDQWSDTIGSTLDACELQDIDRSGSRNFCDGDRIIFVSYPGGAGGFALRYIMLQSPELAIAYDEPIGWITNDGAAHNMLSRFGLKWPKQNGSGWYQMSIDDIAVGMQGKSHSLLSFYMPVVDEDLIIGTRQMLSQAYTMDELPVAGSAGDRPMILVDHICPRAAKAIFPNAKLLALHLPMHQCFRNFWRKHWLHSDGTYSRLHNVLKENGLDDSEESINMVLHSQMYYSKTWHMMFESPYLTSDTYVIDASRLFSMDIWRDEYDSLISYCGLTPNYDAVERFIVDYVARQDDRFNVRR